MVQVSFPGVYIREVPSGARTITGVSTSIALFIGMAQRGEINRPRRVFGTVDFGRIFSEDSSLGEMPDQVRQFFLNGGREAIIVRVASGATTSAVTLQTPAGGAALTLQARSAGAEGDRLRARVDASTSTPENSFNLTLWREEVDEAGTVRVADVESHLDLTLDPDGARFAPTVVDQSSALVTATATAGATGPGLSVAGRLFVADTASGLNAALGGAAGTAREFRIEHGTTSTTVAFALGADDAATVSAIGAALPANVSVALEGAGDLQALVFRSSASPALDVLLSGTGGANDAARALRLGASQGGLEIGRFSAHRPAPNGLSSLLSTGGSTSLQSLLALANLTGDGFGSLAFSTGETVATPLSGTLPLAGSSAPSFAQLGQSLRTLARIISARVPAFRAEVHGLRLVLLPTAADPAAGLGVQVTGGAGAAALFADGGTPLSANVGAYSLGVADAGGSQTDAQPGADGDPPEPEDYADAFGVVEREVDLFNLLILPLSTDDPDGRTAVWGAASVFCQSERAFLLVDMPRAPREVDAAIEALRDLRIGVVKDHSAVYWPALLINRGDQLVPIDPSGSIAGVMSRIDGSRGVWKAPAGTEADVRGIRGVQLAISDREHGVLNPQALNVVRAFPTGIVSWGARTMDGFDNSGNDDYKYVPVRRLTLFIEESLYRGLQFAVFEPNGEELWSQLRLAVGSFLNTLFRRGAFAGKTTRDAYFVKVDSETTTQNDINLGIVNVLVGFAPLKPAEFVVVTIQQKAGQVQV